MNTVFAQAALVDLHDEELKEYLGHIYESLKSLDEQKKNDPQIEKMREELKTYLDEHYNVESKRLKAQLKAARAVAKARGIKWKAPGDQ